MRRYKTIEFKYSVFLTILSLFIIPEVLYFSDKIKQLDYGFIFRFFTIIQREPLESNNLLMNLSNIKSLNFNLLHLFLNIILIYFILIGIEKFFNFKFKNLIRIKK